MLAERPFGERCLARACPAIIVFSAPGSLRATTESSVMVCVWPVRSGQLTATLIHFSRSLPVAAEWSLFLTVHARVNVVLVPSAIWFGVNGGLSTTLPAYE